MGITFLKVTAQSLCASQPTEVSSGKIKVESESAGDTSAPIGFLSRPVLSLCVRVCILCQKAISGPLSARLEKMEDLPSLSNTAYPRESRAGAESVL